MIEQLPLLIVILLVVVAFVAGWVDSVVGGGGLIQLPSLFLALPPDTPPPSILGTNKLSSVAGTLVASVVYLRKIRVDAKTLVPLLIGAIAGAAIGSWLAKFVPREAFTPIILVVLIGVGYYTWRRPGLGVEAKAGPEGVRQSVSAGAIGLIIGGYDGILGPGTGSFFVIAMVTVLGYGFLQASANAKLANLATNLSSIVVLGLEGYLLVGLGLLMAAANLTGGLIGARMALRHGNRFVRIVFLVVVAALIVRLSVELITSWLG